MNVENKTVLVTGAAVRVGKVIASAFAGNGARVVLHYNSSSADAAETLKTIGGEKSGHRLLRADLSESDCAEKIFSQAGHVDILINNASIFQSRPFLLETWADAERQFRINFTSPLELMKKFSMQKDISDGCIINMLDQGISSVSHVSGSYALSKKSLADATLAAALQLAPEIRVNGIAPGPVLPPKGLENSKMEKTLKTVPLRKPVALADIADTCLFLVRNDSITGTVIYVDCGQHLSFSNHGA